MPDQPKRIQLRRTKSWRRLNWASPVEGARYELAGRDLCCWCALSQPCHADVLLEIANVERS